MLDNPIGLEIKDNVKYFYRRMITYKSGDITYTIMYNLVYDVFVIIYKEQIKYMIEYYKNKY